MKSKKFIRAAFRDAVFMRDAFRCQMCDNVAIDAHHITNRNEMPNGGYVPQNGISLCFDCHIKAEQFHSTGISYPGYSPEDLYAKIGSSKELAEKKSNECMALNGEDKI
jgi:hypothetical protein